MKNFLIAFFTLPLFACSQSEYLRDSSSIANGAAVILLDFDGQYVSGTTFGSPITAAPSNANGSTATKDSILNYCREMLSMFNVIVTLDSTLFHLAPQGRKIRVIFTPTCEWFGCSAGGVSFPNSLTWDTNTPSFAFDIVGNTRTKAICAVHEIGHQVGLGHQGVPGSTEYNPGSGTGETGAAPIMGTAYAKNMPVWWSGTLGTTSDVQHDLPQLVTAFGIKPDDVGSTFQQAKGLQNGAGFYGLIAVSDSDYFRIELPESKSVTIAVSPWSTGSPNVSSTFDAAFDIYNKDKLLLQSSNAPTTLNASVTTTLPAGVYYVKVRADRQNANHTSGYGFMGHYSISFTY